jgi:ribose 5-phosphate isomerase A
MTLGLGTGSTVDYFLAALGRRCRDGELPGVRGVPTSVRTEREASSQGIPLTTLEEAGSLDLTVDGADEVNPELDLIKGLGGALLREKMVAQATRRLVIIVDEGKLVHRLGTRGPLPVEVVPFAWKSHLPHIASLGAETVLKTRPDGEPYRTDNGNLVLHCHFPHGIEDPRAWRERWPPGPGSWRRASFWASPRRCWWGKREPSEASCGPAVTAHDAPGGSPRKITGPTLSYHLGEPH